jgi:carbon monoxide dehydrogenase subunit G
LWVVDVTVSQQIDASAEQVAAVLFDSRRDPEWIGGAKAAEPIGERPYGVGYRVKRIGAFLGRKFSWTTEITEYEPNRRVRMKHIAGPFEGGVDYAVAPSGQGSRVTIRNYGKASFSFPFMATMMRMSVAGDLRRLKAVVEGGR